LVLIRHLVRRPPSSAAQVASLTGWVMLIAIMLAPATRVGYLLYPINLFVWAWMLRRAADPAEPGAGWDAPGETEPTSVVAQPGAVPEDNQLLSSGNSRSLRENGVVPAEVVGDATAPTSQ
jgi:hypothetical protein